ncbi:MAG: hypothetical protein MUE81_21720 [Thermoflexibacter sp.]|jgi:hypothetical protein|nr:hypothetical protein [Thermoflexibacter sp.]
MTTKNSDNFDLLFRVAKAVKIGKFLLPLLSVAILYQIYTSIGINNIVGILAIVVVVLATFCFYQLNAFMSVEKVTYKPKQRIILAFSALLLVVMVLFFSCVFFDYPRNFKQFFGLETVELGEPTKNVLTFQIDNIFYDDCQYPFIYPDTILSAKNLDTLTITESYSENQYGMFAKAPAMIYDKPDNYDSGFDGFYLPLHITSNNVKKIVNIGQTFRVRIKSNKDNIDSLNAGQTCAGEGDFHEPNKIIILSTDKPEYFTDITFKKAPFYTSNPDEQNSFEFYFKIKDAGKYYIEIDVPYTFNGKRTFETFKVPPFIAPRSYYLWESTMNDKQFERSKTAFLKWANTGYLRTPVTQTYSDL